MKASKATPLWLALLVLISACVEVYTPDDADLKTGTLVVNADLTDQPGNQTLSISRSDRLTYPVYIPESDCVVEVENETGALIRFHETDPGDYSADIPADFLQTGYDYRILIVTADGNMYESEYTELRPSTEIKEVYYELESLPTSDPASNLEGIRFFIDFEVDPDASPYMKWDLEETYEYHNPNYENLIYGYDRILKPTPDSLVDLTCWINHTLTTLYTLNTGNLSNDEFSRMPLHFVSNETQRLRYGYSLIVKQYSVDEGAFRYWDELKKNTQEMGGIYDRQPSLTPSNICNCNDPEERVLGYFSVSGVSETRIFVKDVEGLDIPDKIFCLPLPGPLNLRYIWRRELPLYLARAISPIDGSSLFGLTKQECQDCRLHPGSSGDPPDYWQQR